MNLDGAVWRVAIAALATAAIGTLALIALKGTDWGQRHWHVIAPLWIMVLPGLIVAVVLAPFTLGISSASALRSVWPFLALNLLGVALVAWWTWRRRGPHQ